MKFKFRKISTQNIKIYAIIDTNLIYIFTVEGATCLPVLGDFKTKENEHEDFVFVSKHPRLFIHSCLQSKYFYA